MRAEIYAHVISAEWNEVIYWAVGKAKLNFNGIEPTHLYHWIAILIFWFQPILKGLHRVLVSPPWEHQA